MICSKANSLEALKEKSEHELGSMLGENNVKHEEELRRLCRALRNLRRYMGNNLFAVFDIIIIVKIYSNITYNFIYTILYYIIYYTLFRCSPKRRYG